MRSTPAGPAPASPAGRKGIGKGRGGMRTWKGKKSGESSRAHTLKHTPAWERMSRSIAGKSDLIGRNFHSVIRYFYFHRGLGNNIEILRI